MNKEKQITIKYSKGLENSTQVINEKDYNKAKNRLGKLGYKVSKCDTNEKTTK